MATYIDLNSFIMKEWDKGWKGIRMDWIYKKNDKTGILEHRREINVLKDKGKQRKGLRV